MVCSVSTQACSQGLYGITLESSWGSKPSFAAPFNKVATNQSVVSIPWPEMMNAYDGCLAHNIRKQEFTEKMRQGSGIHKKIFCNYSYMIYVFFVPPFFCRRIPAFWSANLGKFRQISANLRKSRLKNRLKIGQTLTQIRLKIDKNLS